MPALLALAFLALAALRGPMKLGAGVPAALLGLLTAGLGWAAGHTGPAIAAEAAAALVAAWGAFKLHDDAPPERVVRGGLLLVGAAALWSVPPLAASIAIGARALDRPDLVEVQLARLSLHHPATWRAAEAGAMRTLAPREGGDAWLTLRAIAAKDAAALEAALKPMAELHGATLQPKVRGPLVGFQARALGGDAKVVFWGCEAFPGPDGAGLVLEYGVSRGSPDPRQRIRELEATLATLQPGE